MRRRQERASRARCGVYDCGTCALYLDRVCPGCARGNLKLLREGDSPCAVYACVRELGVVGCYECAESPCRVGVWQVSRCPLRGRYGGEAQYDEFSQALSVTRGSSVRTERETAPARATMERLRWYLQAMEDYAQRSLPTISSHHLARAVGVRSGLVRRDLAGLGHLGTPGRGYEVEGLRQAIRSVLKLGEVRAAVWLGARRLREDEGALEALGAANCQLVGVFDVDPDQVGQSVAGLRVQPLPPPGPRVRMSGAELAVVACEGAARPEVVQMLAQAGVKALLNLTKVALPASAQLVIEQADVGSQLLRLLARVGAREQE